MKSLALAFLLLMSLLTAPAAAQDFGTGREAFNRGDYKAALREWQPLALRGNADAQASLGLLYARGDGVRQDYSAAVRWFHEAAQQGHALGQNNLGVMYRNGHGVPQDYRMAITLYRLSAAQGYVLAQASLGAMYQNGEGTKQDFEQAYMWYTLAAEQGHEGAAKARSSLGLLMSDEEKQHALDLARERRQRATRDQMALPTRLSPEGPAAVPNAGPEVADGGSASQTVSETPAAAARPGSAWRVQLVAMRAEAEVAAAWQRLQKANGDLLKGLELHVEQADLPRGTYFRVQAGPLADRASAASLCASLKSRNQDCLIVVPDEPPVGQL